MAFAEHDYVIETLAPEGPDQPQTRDLEQGTYSTRRRQPLDAHTGRLS
jgi:hypothetical protein